MKILQHVLAANLCGVLPLLWVCFSWMPEQVKMETRGNGTTPVAVMASGVVLQGQEHGQWKEGTVWKFYLREGMKWNDLTFRLPEGTDGGSVGRVWVEKWKLLSFGKSGAGLEKKDGGKNDYSFGDPRFEWVGVAQGKVPLCLAGAEVLILGLSWRCARRHRKERWKTLLPSVLGVAFALSLLMQVTLPVQSYVTNQSAFSLTPWELFEFVTSRFLVALVCCVVCLGLLSRCFGRWVLALVLAFAICAYLESGVLSAGWPSLNGDLDFFMDRGRGLKDLAVWGGVCSVMLGLYRWIESWMGVAGLCLAGVFGAAILDAKPEEKADISNLLVNDFSSINTVLQSVTYSTNHNVMVFIIDSLERHQAHAIMEDPEAGAALREKFLGFTEYTNHVGACEFSLPAVANLMTGNYPSSTMDPDFYASVYSRESIIRDYLEAGYAVFVGTHSLGYGYTNRKREQAPKEDGKSIWKLLHGSGNSGWGLTPVCRFRWVPFLVKASCARLENIGRAIRVGGHNVDKEQSVYAMLADGSISPAETGSFLLVHTDGVHVPVLFNRHGEQLPKENNTDEGCIESGIFILSQLGHLLDVYRQQDIYDRALIMVLADHGHHGGDWASWGKEEKDDELPANACPFLWIKPPHSTHPFGANGAPTTHAKVFAVLKEALARDLGDLEIQELLSEDIRLYRRGADPNWIDYFVTRDNRWHVETIAQKGPEVSEMRPLPLGKMHPLKFSGREMRERGNILFKGFLPQREGALLGWMPIWAPPQQRISLEFKVASASCGYHVQLIGHVGNDSETDGQASHGCVRFSSSGCEDGKQATVCKEGVQEIVLDNVRPNKDGIVEIIGSRDEGCEWNIILTQLRITRNN